MLTWAVRRRTIGQLFGGGENDALEERGKLGTRVRDLVERGVASGAFTTPDPVMTASALLSLGIDVARWYRDEGVWTPDDVATHYRRLALLMVGVHR
jgi:hypothetical protein